MKIKLALLFCASLLLPSAAEAAFLTADQVDPARLLPPPPAPGSDQAKAEIAELKHIAAVSTPGEVAAAARDSGDERPDMFQAVLGPGLDLAKLPATSRLLNEVADEEDPDSDPAKAFFRRDRPWIVDPSIKTCVATKPGQAHHSYPSGHATRAFSIGLVLASLVPEKAQAILVRAQQFAENRLVCGMHFRSDIVAGQQLGTVIALDLMRNAKFRVDYDAAKAEIARVAGP